MTITIAFAGKGSAGKTTLLPSLLHTAAALRPHERRLVVDVDPHQSLTTLLGHQGGTTVAALRSAYERALISGAALREDETREAFFEARMGAEALLAADGYDFLSLGQWELAGSQCTPNRVMERALGGLLARYDLALLDNEAGVEHIGRYAGVPLDAMVMVATPARMSLAVAGRIVASASRLRARPRLMYLLLNRVRAGDLGRPHVVAALDQLNEADVRFLGAVSEADDEPHTLGADHAWHGQLAPLWRTLLGQVRAAAALASPGLVDAIRANGHVLTLAKGERR
ncbi:AAA family ATPase [Chloroflexales bacterium ZM16-3]|nr:AAA family ATPase [Chloroflexales bacterium ZM16-3]